MIQGMQGKATLFFLAAISSEFETHATGEIMFPARIRNPIALRCHCALAKIKLLDGYSFLYPCSGNVLDSKRIISCIHPIVLLYCILDLHEHITPSCFE